MAKFKLALLIPILTNNENKSEISYHEDVFTNFHYDDQYFLYPASVKVKNKTEFNHKEYWLPNTAIDNTENFSFSFDENIIYGQNSQNTLTFKMLKYVQLENERVLNPYAAQMSVGSRIRLYNKFEKICDFIIKNIEYEIKNANVVLNYECQDFFSYRHIRQNSGYTIENSETSVSFIGAKTIDEWVEKICKECFVSYTYDKLADNKKYKDLNKSITFAISNSNALNALITLGEQQGFNLVVDDGNKKFWYEPNKNDEFSGLYYSPQNDLQSVEVSQDGAALTTILNVTGQKIDDIELTILPTVPQFFLSLFNLDDWTNMHYEPDFYTRLIRNREIKEYFDATTLPDPSSSLVINNHSLEYTFKIPVGNYISLELSPSFALYKSDLTAVLKDDIQNYNLSLKIGEDEYSSDLTRIDFGDQYKNIVGKEAILTIDCETLNMHDYTIINIGLLFSRIPTQEEIDFAEMADKIPWLENKIIDISYFYDRGLLSDAEYQKFLSMIFDELRSINGKLIYETNNYYMGYLKRINVLAELNSAIEVYLANFNTNIVNHIKNSTKDESESLIDYLGKRASLVEDNYSKIYQFIQSIEVNDPDSWDVVGSIITGAVALTAFAIVSLVKALKKKKKKNN